MKPLHRKSPPAMIERRFPRSAQRAIGKIAALCTSANQNPPSAPIHVSETPNSPWIGRTRIEIRFRSATLSAVVNISSVMASHADREAPGLRVGGGVDMAAQPTRTLAEKGASASAARLPSRGTRGRERDGVRPRTSGLSGRRDDP